LAIASRQRFGVLLAKMRNGDAHLGKHGSLFVEYRPKGDWCERSFRALMNVQKGGKGGRKAKMTISKDFIIIKHILGGIEVLE